jgi:hypothetical protein
MTKLLMALALGTAMALGGSAAMAAPPPSVGFDFHVGPGGDPSFGVHLNDDHGRGDRGDRNDRCLDPRQIFRKLQAFGYDDFRMVDRDRHTFTIDASRGFHRDYELTVDNCNGDILDRERIRR